MTPFPSPPSRASQRGAGLLQALLLIVLVGAATVAGLTLLRSQQPADQAAQQEDALRWADEALAAYAAAHAHLPCPVSGPTSPPTACVGPGEKGWLPTRALEAVHPGGAGPMPPMRYVVFRGAAEADLAAATNTFSPHTWERTAHSLDPINGLDFCAKLGAAARATHVAALGDRARTVDASGAQRNIAYGLVAPGPTAGLGGRFDGANQGSDAAIASPSLPTGPDYDDRTRARGFADLAQTLGCGFVDPATADGLTLAAVDMLALAVDVSDEVNEQHEGNKEDTQLAVAMASVSTVFAGINVALAGASIANSVSTLATASAQLTAAIASCAVLVGCGLIPPYTAAVTAAGVAIGLAATATGLAAGALIPTSIALALTIEARDMAQQGLPSAAIDFAAATERTCLAAEGGYVTEVADANGILVPVVPPVFRNGLRQERDATLAELAGIQGQIDLNRARIAELELIPSTALIAYPAEPVRGDLESDDSWNARYQAYLNTRAQYEAQLVAKLEAIRAAKLAHFNYDTATQTVANAENELADLQASIDHLRPRVTLCDANPPAPSDLVGLRRCENDRRSLLGLTTCDASVLTAAQVRDRQCLPWKLQDRDDAVTAQGAAKSQWDTLEAQAFNMPEPPLKDYVTGSTLIGNVRDCELFGLCRALIISTPLLFIDELELETYENIIYRSMGLEVALREKRTELDEKEAAYQTAQEQCDSLRALNAPGGASGTEEAPAWVGANAIMQAANCRGASGAVTPATCGATP
jgi:hypothetical protein